MRSGVHKRVASGLGGEVTTAETGEQTETAWAVLSEEDEEEVKKNKPDLGSRDSTSVCYQSSFIFSFYDIYLYSGYQWSLNC